MCISYPPTRCSSSRASDCRSPSFHSIFTGPIVPGLPASSPLSVFIVVGPSLSGGMHAFAVSLTKGRNCVHSSRDRHFRKSLLHVRSPFPDDRTLNRSATQNGGDVAALHGCDPAPGGARGLGLRQIPHRESSHAGRRPSPPGRDPARRARRTRRCCTRRGSSGSSTLGISPRRSTGAWPSWSTST